MRRAFAVRRFSWEKHMIKTSLKNFCNSILYVFIPMGIIYLFVLLALFGFLNAAIGSATSTLDELSELISGTVTQSEISVSDFIVYAGEKLTWDGNIFNYIGQIIDTEWVLTTIKEFFELLGSSSEAFTADFTAIVVNFSVAIRTQFALAIVCCYLGLLFANYATGFVVRRKNARRGFKKWVVANTVIPFVESLVLSGAFALAGVIRYYSLLVFAVIVTAYAFLALTSSWIVYGNKTVAFKDVVNGKNLLEYLVSVALIFLCVAAFFFLVMLINFVLAALIVIPIVVYALNIIKVNADSYVKGLAESKITAEQPAQTLSVPPESEE